MGIGGREIGGGRRRKMQKIPKQDRRSVSDDRREPQIRRVRRCIAIFPLLRSRANRAYKAAVAADTHSRSDRDCSEA